MTAPNVRFKADTLHYMQRLHRSRVYARGGNPSNTKPQESTWSPVNAAHPRPPAYANNCAFPGGRRPRSRRRLPAKRGNANRVDAAVRAAALTGRPQGLRRGSTFPSGSVTSPVGWIVRVGFPGVHGSMYPCLSISGSMRLSPIAKTDRSHLPQPQKSPRYIGRRIVVSFSTCNSNRNK